MSTLSTVRSALALALSALLSCAGMARADALLDLDTSEARTRFTRGVQLYHEGSYDAALAEFTRAYRLAPNYRVLYNLAQVQAERHDYVAAVRLLEEYVKQGDSEIGPERRAKVADLLDELKSRLAVLWVRSSIPAAELLVDGQSAGVLPLSTPLLLSAGVHQLQLRDPSETNVNQVLTLAGNEVVQVELPKPQDLPTAPLDTQPEAPSEPLQEIAPAPPAAPARATAPHVAPAAGTSPMWISLISTAVLAGGALSFGVLARAANEDLELELARLPADRARIDDARADLRRNALLFDGLTAGALIAAGLSIYFALSSASEPTQTEQKGVRVGADGLTGRF